MNSTVSVDRRDTLEQDRDKQLIIGLNSHNGDESVLAKLSFQGGISEQETEIILSDPVAAELCKCHTIS